MYAAFLAPAVISADSPRFLGFIPAAPTKASLLFDMLISCASIQGISWLEAAGAIHAENQVLRLIADRAGLPARRAAASSPAGRPRTCRRSRSRGRWPSAGPATRPGPPLAVAVSADAHSSIDNTLRLLEMDPLIVPATIDRLTGEAARAAIEADGDPASLAAVVATSGTTNAGIIDDLDGLAAVAREHDLWFHVDGAYGGAGLFAPSVRAAYAGIEHADSFVVDPHKWLFSPFDCAALLYRDPALARSVHTQDASYLDVIHEQPGDWNPTDYAYHLTRRARGLPLWFSLCVYGVRAYTAAIETAIGLAQQAAAEIAARDYLELVREPGLSVVLFRRRGWSPADYRRWADKLLADQVAFMPPTTWEGETVARFAFLHPHTPWTWSPRSSTEWHDAAGPARLAAAVPRQCSTHWPTASGSSLCTAVSSDRRGGAGDRRGGRGNSGPSWGWAAASWAAAPAPGRWPVPARRRLSWPGPAGASDPPGSSSTTGSAHGRARWPGRRAGRGRPSPRCCWRKPPTGRRCSGRWAGQRIAGQRRGLVQRAVRPVAHLADVVHHGPDRAGPAPANAYLLRQAASLAGSCGHRRRRARSSAGGGGSSSVRAPPPAMRGAQRLGAGGGLPRPRAEAGPDPVPPG